MGGGAWLIGYLVDVEAGLGRRGLADADGAAPCRLTLHDGEDLQGGGGRGQVEVGEAGLLQVVEVPLGEGVPGTVRRRVTHSFIRSPRSLFIH